MQNMKQITQTKYEVNNLSNTKKQMSCETQATTKYMQVMKWKTSNVTLNISLIHYLSRFYKPEYCIDVNGSLQI